MIRKSKGVFGREKHPLGVLSPFQRSFFGRLLSRVKTALISEKEKTVKWKRPNERL